MRVLVLPAACMHGAFVAGVLAGLETMGIAANYFKAIICASAGAWNGAYYITGDLQGKGWRLWCVHLPEGFLCWKWCWPHADIAYLEYLTRERERLDVVALRRAKTDLFVVVTDMRERCASYINLNARKDAIPYLIASSAIPILSSPQEIGGRTYGDGGLVDAIPLRAAERLGADEIWLILNVPVGYRESALGWWLISRFARSSAERCLCAASTRLYNDMLAEIEHRHDLFVIRPSAPLPASRFTRDPAKMRMLFDMGKRTGMEKTRMY